MAKEVEFKPSEQRKEVSHDYIINEQANSHDKSEII